MIKLKSYLNITLSILLLTAGVHFFMIPGGFVIGSVTGLSMILAKILPIPVSILVLIINGLLLLLSLIILGRDFGAKSIYGTILLSVFLRAFELLFPETHSITGNQVFDLCGYILIGSLSQALLFKENASSGGLDIVAKIICNYIPLEIGTGVMVCGLVVAASSVLVYDLKTAVVSCLGTYANGLVIDYFVDGFKRKKKICIISDDYEKIRDFVLHTMHRGVTLGSVIGGYEKVERVELQIIVSKYEYKRILEFLAQENIKAFVTITNISEVVGIWNNPRK